jgi:hypothetical protein
VGIDVLVQSEAGETLNSLPDPADLFPQLLSRVDVSNTVCVRLIDPWDDIVFDQAQAAVLVGELEVLKVLSSGPTAEFLEAAIALARLVTSDGNLKIMFQGD